MRTMTVFLVAACVAWLGLPAFAEDAPSPTLSEEEYTELLTLLDESRDMLMKRITRLTDEQWNYKTDPDRWSVRQCVEHIIRSERALLDYAMNAMKGGADKDWVERTKGKTDLLRQVMPNRNPGGAGGASPPGTPAEAPVASATLPPMLQANPAMLPPDPAELPAIPAAITAGLDPLNYLVY